MTEKKDAFVTKYKYLPMVVPHLDLNNFGCTRKHREIDSYWLHSKVNSKNKNYVFFDPKGDWFLDYGYSELAVWKNSASHAPRLPLKNSGLGQGKIYGKIFHNIEKLKEQVE